MSVLKAAQGGMTREILEATLLQLAEAMDSAEPQVKAQINAQLLKTVQALDALPAETKDAVDELARRRADRKSTTGTSASSDESKRKQRRARSS